MQNLFLSINVLVQALELAQSKGVFTIAESAQIHNATEIQKDYYKQLSEKLKEQNEAQEKKENTKADPAPETGEQVVDQPENKEVAGNPEAK